jgi:hypothetical protein
VATLRPEVVRVTMARWCRRADGAPFGEWVFSRDIDHQRRLTADGMGRWFAELCAEADLVGVSLQPLGSSVPECSVVSGVVIGVADASPAGIIRR